MTGFTKLLKYCVLFLCLFVTYDLFNNRYKIAENLTTESEVREEGFEDDYADVFDDHVTRVIIVSYSR